MSQPNDLIHQPLRLKLMAALWTRRKSGPVEFAELKKIVGATDGNLGSHLATLEKAGYLTLLKDFVGKRPRTRAALSAEGAKAFRAHVEYLRSLVDDVEL
jgi:DNA-binding transcriptional ArsR family regulator